MKLNEDLASIVDHLTEQRDRHSADLDWIVRVLVDGDLGMSAETLLVLVLENIDLGHRPSDEGDLGRCQRTVDSAPEHHRAAAQAIVKTWRPAVLANYQERIAIYKRQLAETNAPRDDDDTFAPRFAQWLREAEETVARLEAEWRA